MKTKNYFVYCLLLFLLAGCTGHMVEDAGQTIVELPSISLFFYIENDRWPNSIDELKAFCFEKQGACFNVDWDKYTDVTFQELSDGALRIKSGRSQEQNTSFIATLAKPKLGGQEGANK